MKKFEQRFEGESNKGLRKAVRDALAAQPGSCGQRYERIVLGLASKVALTEQGKATLALVAADYRRANGESRRGCDCDSCVAGALQQLGAFG